MDNNIVNIDLAAKAANSTAAHDQKETELDLSVEALGQPAVSPPSGEAAELILMPAKAETDAESNKHDAEGGQENPPAKILDPRPRIELPGPGRLISNVAAELAQVLASCGIYCHAKAAVVYDRESKALTALTPGVFRTQIEEHVIPLKVGPSGDVEQSMSSGDAGAILTSPQFLNNLRLVERLNTVRLPVMRADGHIELLPEGYDRESKILTVQDGVSYATDMPLADAKAFVDGLLEDFPFADDSRSKAIAIAAMLTLISLELMPPRTLQPVFLYRGNVPGVGKGLLAQAAMIPRLDYAPTGAMPRNEEEMRKLLHATAMEGRAVVFLDNVTGRLASPNLEGFITSSTYTGRVLNHSKTVVCSKNTVVFITGNELTLNADMTRRTMVAELYLPGDPADRAIENHLDENRLRELRPQTLAALYAFVREWALAGKPEPTKLNSNFKKWSQVVGGIVEYVGYGSVTTLPPASAAIDPKQADMHLLVEKLHEARQTEAMKFTEVVAIAREHGLFAMIFQPDGDAKAKVENTAFSRFLITQDQRMFPGALRFVIIGKGHARRYAVRRLAELAVAA
jgi:hypothetical protein